MSPMLCGLCLSLSPGNGLSTLNSTKIHATVWCPGLMTKRPRDGLSSDLGLSARRDNGSDVTVSVPLSHTSQSFRILLLPPATRQTMENSSDNAFYSPVPVLGEFGSLYLYALEHRAWPDSPLKIDSCLTFLPEF